MTNTNDTPVSRYTIQGDTNYTTISQPHDEPSVVVSATLDMTNTNDTPVSRYTIQGDTNYTTISQPHDEHQ